MIEWYIHLAVNNLLSTPEDPDHDLGLINQLYNRAVQVLSS